MALKEAIVKGKADQPLRWLRLGLVLTLFVNLTTQSQLKAGELGNHLVGRQELRLELSVRSVQRTRDLEEIRKLLSHDLVHRSLGNLVDLDEISLALPSLEDEALHQLAVGSQDLSDQRRAGLSPVWIVVIAASIVVLIAVLVGCSAGGGSGSSNGG